MAKKKLESSALEKPVRKKKKRTVANKKIDFSDIPELSDAQLASMRRVGRPPMGDAARQLIAIRIDPEVLFRIQEEARQNDIGYQTLINEILAEYTQKAS